MGLLEKILGRSGEDRAVKYLKKQGYTIVKRNFFNRYGEVDIIAKKQNVVVFCEVKTRESDSFGSPSERVDKNKMRRYRLAAREYIAKHKKIYTLRFDIIEVYKNNINHIISAFEGNL